MLADISVHLEDAVGSLGLGSSIGHALRSAIALRLLDLGHTEVFNPQDARVINKLEKFCLLPGAPPSMWADNFFSGDKIVGPGITFSRNPPFFLRP